MNEAEVPVVVAEPILLSIQPLHSRHLEIVDKAGRVITAIEFINPWNKIGRQARRKYCQKQDELVRGGVNLVEIDLVRQGKPVVLAPLDAIPESRRGTYIVSVFRDDDPSVVKAYPISLRDPLPNVPIPLRPKDREVVMQLQPLLDECYRDARCERTNYDKPPVPPLSQADDVEWARSLIREWARSR